jgi:hypothetical protein
VIDWHVATTVVAWVAALLVGALGLAASRWRPLPAAVVVIVALVADHVLLPSGGGMAVVGAYVAFASVLFYGLALVAVGIGAARS